MTNDERKPDEIEITRILNGIHGIPETVKLFAPVGIDRAHLATRLGMAFMARVEGGIVRLQGTMGAITINRGATNGPGEYSPVDALKLIIDELASHTEA